MRKISVLILALAACFLIIAGCTVPSSSFTPAPSPASQPAAPVQTAMPAGNGVTKTVHIIASSFDPAIVTVTPGTAVMWVNEDRINHRVEHLPELPSDKLLFRSESLSPGQSFTYIFDKPGRYKYGDPQQAGGRTALIIVS